MEIQTTVEEFPEKIRQLKISPKASIRVIIDLQEAEDSEKDGKGPEKSKWAAAAKRISKEAPLRGASDDLLKLSRDFRENFNFREPPCFEKTNSNE